jgi:predicted RNase H-like nuclease (RuvC/YqgF family)
MGFIKSTKSSSNTTTTTTGDPKREPPTDAPTPSSAEDVRRENAELRRSLHRLRSDAKIVADAHDKLVETCNALERELDAERERSSELEEKVRALADQLKSVGGHSGSFFSP